MALRNDLNAEVKTDLTSYNGATHGQAYILLGEFAPSDTPVRFYYYSSSSTATVDGENVLNATGMGVGRFIKNPVQEFNPGLATVSTSGSYNDLSSKPTIPAAQVNCDWSASSGIAQILNKPVFKRQETYSGTTNASGIYAVTFGTAFSIAPNISVTPLNGNNKETQIVSVSTTGFSVYVQLRSDVIGLLPTYSNVSGRSVDVIITEK